MENILEGEEGVIIHNPGEGGKPLEQTTETTETTDTPTETTETTTFEPKSWFKEKLDVDFEDEEKFKTEYTFLKTNAQRAAELEAQIAQKEADHKKLTEEYEETFLQKYNLNPNEIRRLLILKEFPDSDAGLITKVIATDYTKAVKDNPMEVLIAKVRLDDPDIFDNDKDAEQEVYKMFGINLNEKKVDPETEEVETDDDGKPIYLYKDENGKIDLSSKMKSLQKAAKEANKKFDEIRNKIPLPEKTDLAANKEKETIEIKEKHDRLRSQWEPTFKNLANKVLDKIKFERTLPDGKQEVFFEFDVDDAFKKEVSKTLTETDLNTLISKGIEYSKEAEQNLEKGAKDALEKKYLSKKIVNAMLLAFEKKLEKSWADKDHIESNNPMRGTGRTNPVKISDKLKAKHDAVDEQIDARLSGRG